MQAQVINTMAVDLGNGFIKHTKDGKTITTEPSIYGKVEKMSFSISKWKRVIKIDNIESVFGNEALILSRQKKVIGDTDYDRYSTQAYIDLLLGVIIADIRNDVEIKKLALGLPVEHHQIGLQENLEKAVVGKHEVYYNGELYIVNIKRAVIMPQVLGTYFSELSRLQLSSKNVLVLEGGHGTFDVANVNQNHIIKSFSFDEGLKKAHVQIENYLKKEYLGYKPTLKDIEQVMSTYQINFNGKKKKVSESIINDILMEQFNVIMDIVVDEFGAFSNFDVVLFGGGFAEVYRKIILQKSKEGFENFKVADKPQHSIVKGMWIFTNTAVK